MASVSKHDVFLSFRGEDTRYNFTDHLYKALYDAALYIFKDNISIPKGEELMPEIKKGVSESRASIVILSETYVTSPWCLEELYLILKQRNEREHIVLPIFYHVKTSDVKGLKGNFSLKVDASTKYTEDNVTRWSEALQKIGDLSGLEASGPETDLLIEIVDNIKKRLDLNHIYRQANLVGMETRYKKISFWLGQSDTEILAIWGMGGSGKTTLARYIAYLNWQNFDSISILEDIGRRSNEELRQLQQKLINDIVKGKEKTVPSVCQGTYTIENALQRKKVLIVLDNIVSKKELDALLGIGPETDSKIIITTRENPSDWFQSTIWSCQEYKMELLEDGDSLELLSHYAFEENSPKENYMELAKKALQYCEGNPLALQVLGSILHRDIRKEFWESTLNSLEREVPREIQSVLITSYNLLTYSQKEVFLHIACFFVGKDKDYVEKILEPDYTAIAGIVTLTNSCLLSVSPDDKLTMQHLLQEMAKTIVDEESHKIPGDRSRVWRDKESHDVLSKGNGSIKVEGLALDMDILKRQLSDQPSNRKLSNLINTNSFERMSKLKLLQLNQLEVTGSYENISTDLRWLCWREFHLEAIPPELDMENLVAIDMSSSKLKVFQPPYVLPALKILNLKDSDNLVEIFDVFRVPNLETLILWNCRRLVRVCDTLRNHKCLTLLNIIGCEKLCKREQRIQLPLFGGRNKKRTSFPLPGSLKQLFLKDCIHEENDYFPITFKRQRRLEYLNLVNSPFELLPNYSHLENLRVLDLSGCGKLKMLLRLPSKLAELYVYHCKSLEKVTFESQNYPLQKFEYEGCINLSEVEHLFKLVPVAKLAETDLKHMKWLREYQDLKVSLLGDDKLTKGRTLCLQMLYESNIMSISMPDIEKPNMIPEYEYTSDNDSLSFKMLSCPKNKRLKGLNVTFKYTIFGDECVWFAKICTTNGFELIYNAKVFGKPASNEFGIWLSYWPIGESLHIGDEVEMAIVEFKGLEIHGCGASLVYSDDEEENEPIEDGNESFVDANESLEDNDDEYTDILGVDISGFKLSTGKYYLCRRDYSHLVGVGRLTPNWFKKLVGDKIDYTEIGGWRTTGRPEQPYQSFTKLKTVGCIIYGPELEEFYTVEELSKLSHIGETVEDVDINQTMESTSNSPVVKTEYTGSNFSRLSIKMNQDIDTTSRRSALNTFSGQVELSNFLGSLNVLPEAYHAILMTSSAYQLHTNPSGIQILAFNIAPDYTSRFLKGEFDLVSSENHSVVDFISTELNSSFSINKAAVNMFENLIIELSKIENQLTYRPLVVTGQCLGGYLAILFTLWLQHAVDLKESTGYRKYKRPICITFGSPLVGDEALQLAILERPTWNSSFLNVVTNKDPVASYFSSYTLYKPFGTFLFYTESGGSSIFEDSNSILAVIDAMGLSNGGNLNMRDYGNDLMAIRRKVLYRGISKLSEPNLNLFKAGITLQLKEFGVLEDISKDMIERMKEKHENMMRRKQTMYKHSKKLNDMKINLTYMEWYMINCRSKGLGYYDTYKNATSKEEIESSQLISKHHRILNQFWRRSVEKDLMPQEENRKLHWLSSATAYRRINEPLDIAEYYKKGNTNYIENRPEHYTFIEKWLNEAREDLNLSDRKKNKAASLTEDSCFWAHVEDALMSLRDLRSEGSSTNVGEIIHGLERFEGYLMHAIHDFLVSPDIFLNGSSFMKWWNEYKHYRGSLYASKFTEYMNSGSYKLYQ